VRNLELNGRAPQGAEIQRLATVNYGHFTSMQVRDRSVRGLALHFARLADGNEAFFGWAMDVDDEHRVRELVRKALKDETDASVRVQFVPAEDPLAPPDVLVSVADPAPGSPAAPLRLRTDPYQRPWPEHKHVATMGQILARRRAVANDFDDAVFVDPANRVTEGSTWNIALFDGEQVIWPQAPMLKGTTMVLLQVAMTMRGTPWRLRPVDAAELPLMAGAVTVNANHPARPVGSVDGVPFPADDKLTGLLTDAWRSVPLDLL
jgi:branched-subunit amino acid aminotransferase/4-amino-4-deoxychorismate lyase